MVTKASATATATATPAVPGAVAPKKKKSSPKKRASLPPRVAPARLEPAEIAQARASAPAWDRKVRYSNRDFFVHATFGVGLVVDASPEFITCLFEGGETRRLIHARP